MDKFRSFLKNNLVFIIIILLTALTALITYLYPFMGENPFVSEYAPDAYLEAYFGNKTNAFIIDGGYNIAVTDTENALLYKIHGGDPEKTYDTAICVNTDNDGNVLIVDEIYDSSGLKIVQERILRFTNAGKNREIIYETAYLGENVAAATEESVSDYSDQNEMWENNNLKIHLREISIVDGAVYFYESDTEGIYLNRIINGEKEELEYIDMINNPVTNVVSCAYFINDDEIISAFASIDGKVYINGIDKEENSDSGEFTEIYSSADQPSDIYPSIVSDVEFDDEGRLYLNDIGHRKVMRYKDREFSDFIVQDYFSVKKTEEFEYLPIYSSIGISNGFVYVISNERPFVENMEDAANIFKVNVVDTDANIVDSFENIGISQTFRIKCLTLYTAVIVLAVLMFFSLVRVAAIFKMVRTGSSEMDIMSSVLKISVLATAIVVTIIVSSVIFKNLNERYLDKTYEALANSALLICETVDDEYIMSIDSPECVNDVEYHELDSIVYTYLNILGHYGFESARNNGIYTVIYGVKNNVLFELYRDDFRHCVMYPLPGGYDGSVEQNVMESDEIRSFLNEDPFEGDFAYVYVPCYSKDGVPIAIIETGIFYDSFTKSNSALYRMMLINIFSGVIIVMLMIGELMSAADAVKTQKKFRKKMAVYSPSALRPISFLIFFTANITTAFLPIYGTGLWNENFPLPAEMGAALPLSAEFLTSALSSLLSGLTIKKAGVKPICFAGAVFYIVGNAVSAYAWNLWVLIMANSLCGIGGGMLIMGINYRITAFKKEEEQNKGFVAYNGAFLAGMNCGTVIGSLIWENFGYTPAFFTASASAALCVAAVLYFLDNAGLSEVEDDEAEENAVSGSGNVLKRFFAPAMIKWLLFISIPYTLCEAFLSYFYPIIAEENNFTAAEISLAFLISGVISIYMGSVFGEFITDHLGAKKAVVLASFIYAAALIYFVLNPSAWSCYVVIILFAVADSFGLPAHSVYFASCPETKDIGENRALGISGTIDSIASSCGSLVFGGAMMLGVQRGIMLISGIFILFLFLFVVGGENNGKNMSSERGEHSETERNMA